MSRWIFAIFVLFGVVAGDQEVVKDIIAPKGVSDEDFHLFLSLQSAVQLATREDVKTTLETLTDHDSRLARIEEKLDSIINRLDDMNNELVQLKTETDQKLEVVLEDLKAKNASISNLEEKIKQTSDGLAATTSGLNALKATALTDIRLSSREDNPVWKNSGYEDSAGYVITGVSNWNKDEYADWVNRRQVQKLVNGTWRTVSFV